MFDLDGTLIDSTDLIVSSYEHTYRTHGRVTVSVDQIKADLGTAALYDTLARYFRGPELHDAIEHLPLEYNLARHDDTVRAVAGVADAGRAGFCFGGLRLGVVTSKMRETRRAAG